VTRYRAANALGFTLVEMLIALSIFGMLTAAGVALLGVTARTQETSDRLLAEVGEVRRVGALLNADFAQAVQRLHRDADGRPQRAFSGGTGGAPMLLLFVRGGWDGGDGPALQRVGYRLRDGRLERLAFAHVDGAPAAIAVPILDGVTALRLRYRDDEGEWRDRWNPSDETRLPQAIELVTSTATHGTVRQLFQVGSDPR
jgi:general secretion pathway protein J